MSTEDLSGAAQLLARAQSGDHASFVFAVDRSRGRESDRLRGIDDQRLLRWLTATAINRMRTAVRVRRNEC